jgi:S-adenosyl methyltransferase
LLVVLNSTVCGGKDNYPVGRAAADQIITTMPDILVSVRAQRAFLGRAGQSVYAPQFLASARSMASSGRVVIRISARSCRVMKPSASA